MAEGLTGALPGSTVGTDVGSVAASAMGVAPTEEGTFFQSVLYNAMAGMPKARTTMGWNAARMSNSLLHGGFGGNTGALRNHLHPRSMFRVTDPDAVINNARRGGAGYSMFNIAGMVNNGGLPFRKGAGGQTALEARRAVASQEYLMAQSGGDASKITPAMRQGAAEAGTDAVRATRSGRVYQAAVNRGLVDTSMDAYEAGVLGKVTTGMRLSRGVASKGGGLAAEYATMNPRLAASHYMAGAFTSKIGATVGGYMGGARMGSTAVTEGMKAFFGGKPGAQYFTRGASTALGHLGQGGLTVTAKAGGRAGATTLAHTSGKTGLRAVGAGVRTAASQGGKVAAGKVLGASAARAAGGFLANPVVGAAMTAWLVYDVAKIGLGIFRDANERAAEKAREAAKSFKGQIEKPVFGMGFVDNEVAATARSRGVMAIQNSRLNARSILGAEAGPLHAHFG